MHDHTYVEPEQTIFLAGERVVAGHYRRLDAEWIIHLETGDFLPASLDGHVACYVLTAPAQDLISAGLPW